ncbi:hypothetical protein BC831DRAFT_258537 [Entophlyctis helioformis]|nr:hypothetical protein BC831DRAFT_258537 [Entophlyctis helioformis]
MHNQTPPPPPAHEPAQSPLKSSLKREAPRLGLGTTSIMTMSELSVDPPRNDAAAGAPVFAYSWDVPSRDVTTDASLHDASTRPAESAHDHSSSMRSSLRFDMADPVALRKQKDALAVVRHELAILAKQIQKRSDDVTERENAVRAKEQTLRSRELDLADRETSLASMEKRVHAQETRISKEVESLVALRLKQHDLGVKQDAEMIVKRYDDMVEQIGRENKRLQSSLRDLVATNRALRDQNKKMMADMDDKSQRLEETLVLLKQCKERNDRLKTTMAVPRNASSPVPGSATGRSGGSRAGMRPQSQSHVRSDDTQAAGLGTGVTPAAEMMHQMRRLILSQPVKLMVDAHVQTVAEQADQASKPKTVKSPASTTSHSIRDVIKLIHVLFLMASKPSRANAATVTDTMLCDAIAMSFAALDGLTVMDTTKADAATTTATAASLHTTALQIMDMYLELALDLVRRPSATRVQRHTVASLVYKSFMEMTVAHDTTSARTARRTAHGRVLMFLVVLAGVVQTDVLEAMLDGLLSEISSSEASKQAFVTANGAMTVLSMLRIADTQPRLAFLASAVLLAVAGETDASDAGDAGSDSSANLEFLRQCVQTEALDTIVGGLRCIREVPTLENVAAVVQKLSRPLQLREALRSHGHLLVVLRGILAQQGSSASGGTGSSNGQHSSEFVMVNVRSIVQNLEQLE